MHILTVFAHPFTYKYPAAVMEALHEPIRDEGHTVEVLDLHREGFDPCFTEADHAHFWGGKLPADVAGMQSRVEGADRLAFVFPVYWWGMPALMKGWIERVFTGGWAYQYGNGVEDRGKAALTALLGNRPTVLIGIGGSGWATYQKYGYAESMRTQIDVGTFAYCGITDVESHLITDVEGDHNAPSRAKGLETARAIGRAFVSPDRPVRNARDEHLRMRRASA